MGLLPRFGDGAFENQLLTQKLLQEDEFTFAFRQEWHSSFRIPMCSFSIRRSLMRWLLRPLQMGWTAEEVMERVNHSLEFMRITHLKDRPPYRLSGGEKKRVALASVMVLNPDVTAG